MKGPSPSPVPSPHSVWFLTKANPIQAFLPVSEVFQKAECRRCSIYDFGERDLLFVPLKKFGVGLHGLLACRFSPAASPTPHWPDDLSPAQLPGREYRSVQQPGLGRRAVPHPALFNLAPSQLVLNIAVCLKLVQPGQAAPQRGKVLGFFSLLFNKCNGRGN